MSFGKNLQFFRRMYNGMTQEELAEKMEVSRQTVSKWETDAAYPEIPKAMELCRLFSCSMDNLFRDDMDACSAAYSNIRTEEVEGFRYIPYTVISPEPERDAIGHMKHFAAEHGADAPQIIGWDFPFLSQEQINVFHLHGYAAAWVLPSGLEWTNPDAEVLVQKRQRYAAITITEPFQAPFTVIPNAYKTLMAYMRVNGLEHKEDKEVLSCYEREYERDGVGYMDVYIAIQ